jgi:hypothetical protein
MSDLDALTPIEQKTIIFYDDQLTAVLVAVDGRQVVYVPLRSICDYLGVDWSGQRQRILRDAVLSDVVSGVVITPTPLDNRFANPQEMLCIPLDYLNGFLFGINANRVKAEIRERLIRYQKECYRVLADAFLETSVADEDWMTTSPETRAALERIREMGQAVARMADEQLRIMTRLDKAAIVVGQHNRRITALERQLSPRDAITEEQAADIAEKVKAIAMALTEQDSSKNHFQAIFSELYRRFRVSGYKNIRQSQYHEVLDFLDEWLAAGSKNLGDGNNQDD